MNTYIALFRGLNVGGHHPLPMRELAQVLERVGLQKIETYIQSGNVVFDSQAADPASLSDRIRNAIIQSHGFGPDVLLLSAEELAGAIGSNPYPEAESEPTSLHLYFLASEPLNPDLNKLADLKRENEEYALKGKVFYLHAPDGIGRSKLAAGVEKALGVTGSARNWRTVCKLMEMASR